MNIYNDTTISHKPQNSKLRKPSWKTKLEKPSVNTKLEVGFQLVICIWVLSFDSLYFINPMMNNIVFYRFYNFQLLQLLFL